MLDLYAGSGALGLEALSRGAASAVFVESDQRAAAVIVDNVRSLGAAGGVVRCASVASVLAAAADNPVDLVFADPPYDVASADVEAVLSALSVGGWVTGGALAVIERRASSEALTWPAQWAPERDRRYGDTRLEFGTIA